MKKITSELIQNFKEHLINDEKANATIEKYVHDIIVFMSWLPGSDVNKANVLEYKRELINKYAPASVNAAISSLNSFFDFNEWHELKIKALKIQKQIFATESKELTKGEYERLLTAANKRNNKQLYYLIQTICSTGIRVSELKAITVESIKCGQATINCKGKMRIIILPKQLCKMLKTYIADKKISRGSVFVSKYGKPLDRSNIWKMLKGLCESAGVSKEKVFPHNFRHLFARTYYSLQKDIVRLADILGHSSVNTTRIYTMENPEIHRSQIQKLGLLLC